MSTQAPEPASDMAALVKELAGIRSELRRLSGEIREAGRIHNKGARQVRVIDGQRRLCETEARP